MPHARIKKLKNKIVIQSSRDIIKKKGYSACHIIIFVQSDGSGS